MDVNTLYKLLELNHNNRELVSDLLNTHPMLLDAELDNGSTLLIKAVSSNYIIIVEELIRSDADLNKSMSKNTPLILAVFSNKPDLAEMLINNGCDTKLEDRLNKTARDYLYKITDETAKERIRLAIDSVGQQVKNSADFTVNTLAILLAKNRSNENLISTLIKTYSALLNDTLESGNTLLTHFARNKDNLFIVKELANKADLNKKDSFEQSPLWLTVELRCFETAELLINAGALKDVRNKHGMSIYAMISGIADPIVKEKFCTLFEFNITEKPIEPAPLEEKSILIDSPVKEVDSVLEMIICLLKTKKDFSYKNGQLIIDF